MTNQARVPCLNCGKELRMTMEQSKAQWRTGDGQIIVFCSGKCQKAYIADHGKVQQKAAMEKHAENLGISVEDLPR